MTANSITELADLIRCARTPTGTKRIAEFSSLRSFAFTSLFIEVFGCEGLCRLDQGDDPPDFCLTTATAKISVEVTSFTTGGLRIYRRERHNPQPYTSMLRLKKPSKQFRSDLAANQLPDDSSAIPHFESRQVLDNDYYEIASNGLNEKLTLLAKYWSKYGRNVLLIQDELSEFKSDFERRIPVLRSVPNSIQSRHRFDDIILVDGNHHNRAHAFKLWGD